MLERKSVSVTNENIKGEEKMQGFIEYLLSSSNSRTPCIKDFACFLKNTVFIISQDFSSFGTNSANYQGNYLYMKHTRLAKAEEFGHERCKCILMYCILCIFPASIPVSAKTPSMCCGLCEHLSNSTGLFFKLFHIFIKL